MQGDPLRADWSSADVWNVPKLWSRWANHAITREQSFNSVIHQYCICLHLVFSNLREIWVTYIYTDTWIHGYTDAKTDYRMPLAHAHRGITSCCIQKYNVKITGAIGLTLCPRGITCFGSTQTSELSSQSWMHAYRVFFCCMYVA